MTRTKTRGTLPLASLDTLIDQVGVSGELGAGYSCTVCAAPKPSASPILRRVTRS